MCRGYIELSVRGLRDTNVEVLVKSNNVTKQNDPIDNGHQKTVSGKKQRGPDDKAGNGAGGNAGSQGQNMRATKGKSVGSHKPGGDGPGTKTFKHEHDDGKHGRRD